MHTEEDERNALGHAKELLKIICDRSSPDKAIQIDHMFRCPTEESATHLRNALLPLGYDCEIEDLSDDPESEDNWLLQASISQTPVDAASEENIKLLFSTGSKFDCFYDGWGASI